MCANMSMSKQLFNGAVVYHIIPKDEEKSREKNLQKRALVALSLVTYFLFAYIASSCSSLPLRRSSLPNKVAKASVEGGASSAANTSGSA